MLVKITQTIKFVWLILSTIKQNSDIVLDTLEFCYFLHHLFHKVVQRHIVGVMGK